jgi:hypothetical protein
MNNQRLKSLILHFQILDKSLQILYDEDLDELNKDVTLEDIHLIVYHTDRLKSELEFYVKGTITYKLKKLWQRIKNENPVS